jgi:hypothetical protein
MLARKIVLAVCASVAPPLSWAANVITVWEATGPYSIQQGQRTVEVQGAGVFKLQATGDEPDGFGDIQSITVASYVTGTVELTIRAPEGGPGAWDVHVVNLSGSATTRIVELQVAHELAGDGEVVATSIDGVFYVLRNGETPGYIAGNITVAQYNGQIHCLGMRNLTVTGAGPHSGTITVDADYYDDIFIGGSASVAIDIGGDLFGVVGIYGDSSGGLSVGPMHSNSGVHVNGSLAGGLQIGGPGTGHGYVTAGSVAS